MTKKITQPDGTVVEVVELACCACGGKVSFATPETSERPLFFHTMPLCARFESTNTGDQVVAYMRECVDKAKSLN
jgi:hypothetical protein